MSWGRYEECMKMLWGWYDDSKEDAAIAHSSTSNLPPSISTIKNKFKFTIASAMIVHRCILLKLCWCLFSQAHYFQPPRDKMEGRLSESNASFLDENLGQCRDVCNTMNCILVLPDPMLCDTKDMGSKSKSGTKLPPFLYFLLFHAPIMDMGEYMWGTTCHEGEGIGKPSIFIF